MSELPKNNPEKRSSGCKGYCDRGINGEKKICNSDCRKIGIIGDKSNKEFQYSINEKDKIKYIISRYKKYITPENFNNYLFVAEINREIKNILNIKPKSQLDIFKNELY